jgi:predicted ATP-grasp superfamily ATP-dependent carboligase
VKPLRGARGAAIRPWQGQLHGREKKRFYLQERIEGDSGAAIYIASASSTLLLGVTRQLVGEEWLHAGPFSYCGSIGPLPLEPSLYSALEQLGMVVAANIGLRGLFGIDFIQRDGIPWPVEINPRYTASVEVLELADGISALSLHRQVFEAFPERHTSPTPAPALCRNPKTDSPGALGKAVLFARAPLVFPDDGHWKSYREECRETRSLWNIPAFADIPPPGRRIEAGGPILTFFAEEESIPECLNRLREMARDLDRRLGND